MTPRRSLTRAQRVRLFDEHKGICIHCGQKIHAERGEKWHVGHIIALALGGKDEPENMGPAHDHCNMADAYQEVIPKRAKADRIRARHLGVKKRQSRPIPGSKDSGWKHKMDGTWERR